MIENWQVDVFRAYSVVHGSHHRIFFAGAHTSNIVLLNITMCLI